MSDDDQRVIDALMAAQRKNRKIIPCPECERLRAERDHAIDHRNTAHIGAVQLKKEHGEMNVELIACQAEIERLERIEIKYNNLCNVLNEQVEEIKRLQSEREHYRQTYLGVQAEYEKAQTREKRLRAALEEITERWVMSDRNAKAEPIRKAARAWYCRTACEAAVLDEHLRRALDNIKVRAYELGQRELHDMALEALRDRREGE